VPAGKKASSPLPLEAVCVAALLAACSGSNAGSGSSPAASADNAAIAADFANHRSKVEVTADGIVVRLFPDRQSSTGTHEQFIIRLTSQNQTVEIEHDISIGKRVPVAQGDEVIVHGEYIWNAQGGLIHFTHHDPQATHEGGYIIDDGKTYD
jgi:hypothetical protein